LTVLIKYIFQCFLFCVCVCVFFLEISLICMENAWQEVEYLMIFLSDLQIIYYLQKSFYYLLLLFILSFFYLPVKDSLFFLFMLTKLSELNFRRLKYFTIILYILFNRIAKCVWHNKLFCTRTFSHNKSINIYLHYRFSDYMLNYILN